MLHILYIDIDGLSTMNSLHDFEPREVCFFFSFANLGTFSGYVLNQLHLNYAS